MFAKQKIMRMILQTKSATHRVLATPNGYMHYMFPYIWLSSFEKKHKDINFFNTQTNQPLGVRLITAEKNNKTDPKRCKSRNLSGNLLSIVSSYGGRILDEPRKKTLGYFPKLYWLFDKDPYKDFLHSPHNWVVCHPLCTLYKKKIIAQMTINTKNTVKIIAPFKNSHGSLRLQTFMKKDSNLAAWRPPLG